MCRRCVLFFGLAMALANVAIGQQPTPVQPAPLHVLKIVAGPSGAEANGTFQLTEERSKFNRSDDREVIVFFQWEGSAGAHKLSAQWRSPDAGLTSTSVIDYRAADRRFGAFWRLTLSPSIPLGIWSIEATVDGQPAGRHTFEITDSKVSPVEMKRPLTQAQLYERLTRMFVVFQRSSVNGRELDPAAGFSVVKGQLHTVMAAVDDTHGLRAVSPDGSSREVTALVGWNRRQEWAVLADIAPVVEPVPVTSPDPVRVGDRCFSMEGGATGGRVLVEGTITGQTGPGPATSTPIVTFVNGSGTPGAPVLNEFGELIGMVGAAGVPGATRLIHVLRFRAQLKGAPVVPLALVHVRPDSTPASLEDLRARGELVRALNGDQHVVSGGFARAINKGATVAPSEQSEDFQAREKGFVVFVTWSPQQRLKGLTTIKIYDADNRVVVESKPKKSDFRKGDLALSSWDVPMLPHGIYRADVLVDDNPVWRGFVRINP